MSWGYWGLEHVASGDPARREPHCMVCDEPIEKSDGAWFHVDENGELLDDTGGDHWPNPPSMPGTPRRKSDSFYDNLPEYYDPVEKRYLRYFSPTTVNPASDSEARALIDWKRTRPEQPTLDLEHPRKTDYNELGFPDKIKNYRGGENVWLDRRPATLYRGVPLDMNHPELEPLRHALYGKSDDVDDNSLFDVSGFISQISDDKMRELGPAVLDHLYKQPNRHWSTERQVANEFAHNGGPQTVPAVLTADWMGAGEDPYRLRTHGDYDHEDELSLILGAPLKIRNLHVKHPVTGEWKSILRDPMSFHAAIDRDVAEDLMKLAMPAPMPEGITFHHHPTDETVPTERWMHGDPNTTVMVPKFSAPAVEARHNGKTVGYLEWDPPLKSTVVNGIQYGDHPPEVSMIRVHKDYRRHGIGTALFDFAKQHQGDLEHSDSRTELGNKWIGYEQSRQLTAMPSRDAYDYMVSDRMRKTDDIPESGDFYHGSNHDHQPGDILESVRARGDQDRLDYYNNSIGAPNQADWVWMYNHPAPGTKYHKNVYQLEPLDEGPWIWNNYKREDGSFSPGEIDEDFPRLVSPRARVVRKLSPEEYAAAAGHMNDYYDRLRAERASRLAMPAIDAYDDDDEEYNVPRAERAAHQDVEPGPYFHATDKEFPVGHVLLPRRELGLDANPMIPNHSNWLWMSKHPSDAHYHAGYGDTNVYEVEPLDEGPWKWNKHPDWDDTEDGGNRYVSPRARVVRKIEPDENGEYHNWKPHIAARLAMPNPLPQGVHFRYHPELMWSPGVTAHYQGKQIGSLEWYDDDHVMVDLGTRKPGEIDRINVHPDHQGNSVASSMFDFAKQYEPRLHHSDQLTEDGRGWSEYEKSRNARLAMAWQDWAPHVDQDEYEDTPPCVPGECNYGGSRLQQENTNEYFVEHENGGYSSLGYGHYKDPDGNPYIGIHGLMTDENHRQDGVAEALIRRLHQDHPGIPISTGYMTDGGRAFHDKMLDKEPDARGLVTAGRNGDPPPMTFEPFNTMWSNGIMARHAEDGRPIAHLHWHPDGEIEQIRVHPQLQGRDIAKHILAHAATHPETYEARQGIKPSNHMTPSGRAFARSLGHAPADDEVTPAEDETEWAWKAVDNYVPMHIPYTGQNEDEMSRYLEQPWQPPNKTASLEDEGWPVWWRNRHRPPGPWDKRWHPNHPEHTPAPWDN